MTAQTSRSVFAVFFAVMSGLLLFHVLTPGVGQAAPGQSLKKKETMLYHGNGFAIRPAVTYGWDYRGHKNGRSGSQMLAGPKDSITNHLVNGRTTWTKWKKNEAVGRGVLWTHCGTLRNCASSPWFGDPKVKVKAFRLRSGHFTRIRITRIGEAGKQFMLLRFNGKPVDGPPWTVIREVVG